MIPRGMIAYLFLSGWTSGLIARGTVLCAPFLAARLNRPGTVGLHVLVEWEQALGLGDRIPVEILQSEVPACGWQSVDAEAVPLAIEPSERVSRLWSEWLDRAAGRSGRRSVASETRAYGFNGEV